MRKKFIYFALVPLVILILVVYLFIDSWITSGLETAGEAITGAKVEVENLHVSLSPIGIQWMGLQAADPREPMSNLFETGKVQIALNFGQLLRGKYIVETMEVSDLVLGTRRSTSGELPRKAAAPKTEVSSGPGAFSSIASQATSAFGGSSAVTPNFDIASIRNTLKIDSLLDPHNLKSYQLIDSLNQQVQAASVQWQTTLKEFDQSKQKLASIETNVKSINVNNLKTIEQITSALNNVKSSINTADEVQQTFAEQQKTLTASVNRFASSAQSIDAAAKQDYDHVLRMARLPDVSMKGLAALVLGNDITARATKYLYWIDFARKNIPTAQTKEEKVPSPARMKGQNIHFPEERSYPKFWIRKILISGGTDKDRDPEYFYAKGEVLNITNNQHLTGKPMTMALSLTRGGATTLAVDASFDRRTEKSLDLYKATLTGVKVGSMQIGRTDFLPSRITNANADASIDVRVPGNTFDSDTRIQFSNIAIKFEADPKNTVERIVRDVLQSVKAFHVNLRMWNPGNAFDIAFTTDLDDQIASRTKKVVGDEIARIQNDLRNQLNQRIAAKKKEFEALYSQKRDEVMGKLKGYENLVNQNVALVQAKKSELEKKVNDEQKKQEDALKKKGQDLLKGLLKKK